MVAASPGHIPVLCEETLDLLAPAVTGPGAVLVDGTLGLGGHAEAALRRWPELTVVGIDRDTAALGLARSRLAPFGSRFTAVHTTYDHIARALSESGFSTADGVLLDLGVSSMQLDERERGFAYSYDAPLDMRMDTTTGATAADLLADSDAAELARILRDYGEERFAKRIASAIVRTREGRPLRTSADLVEVISEAVPARAQQGGHPAKRTFQALRIAVNDELRTLQRALPAALDSLRVGGRLAVLSYHSLEDRMVKRALAAGSSPSVPPDLPVVPDDARPWLHLLTRGAQVASAAEVNRNRRAASVRLRAAEKTRQPAGAHAPLETLPTRGPR